MDIEFEGAKSGKDVNSALIPVGVTFSGSIGEVSSVLFLKVYDGIVDLEKPQNTWQGSSPMIRNYREVRAKVVIY